MIVIAGPTASGKTGYSLKQANSNNTIINADSIQLYKGLPILTACPSAEEKKIAPHFLFEFLNNESYSIAQWYDAVADLSNIHDISEMIVVGGTGFYISSLFLGLPPVPNVPEDIHQEVLCLYGKLGRKELREYVYSKDPLFSLKKLDDPQRLMRALEVLLATGESIVKWQEKPRIKKMPVPTGLVLILPDREKLYHSINLRFDIMVESGVIEEVEMFLNSNALPHPLERALGFHEIKAYIEGILSKDEMLEQSKKISRNYAKRQITWFKNQFKDLSLFNARIIT